MNHEMFTSIIYNVALLLTMIMIYTIISRRQKKFGRVTYIAMGIITGLIGIIVMSTPFELMPGLIFDVRSILLGISGIFLGFIPTVIAGVMTAGFRFIQGGIGMWTGLGTIVFSACFGLLWRRFRYKKMVRNKRSRIIELYFFGILTHVGMLAFMLLMPWDIAVATLQDITLPVMIIYPVGTVLHGILMFRQIDNDCMITQLKESEARYRSLFENNHTVMLLENPASGQIIDANPAACSFYGWTYEEITNKKTSDINIMSDEQVAKEVARTTAKNLNHYHFKHQLAIGAVREVEVFSEPIIMNGKEYVYSIIHDVTKRRIAQKQLKESEERLRVTLLSVGDGVITTDNEGKITLINNTALEITKWTKDVIGKPINSILNVVNEDTKKRVEDPVGKVLKNGQKIDLANHSMLVREDGFEVPIADSAAPIKDDNGNLLGVVLVIRDVTQERKRQEEIKYLGYHDSLTGLYNRTFFDEELKRLDVKSNLPLSVIIGDVNGLKLTNDAFGHAFGDQLLKDMAVEIKKACRKEDIVARWGGDEFVVLLPATDENEVVTIYNRIKENCARVKMSEMEFSISLGYDTKRSSDENMTDVIKGAEDFMYRKKSTESLSMRGNTINTILMTLHEKSQREQLHSNRVSELCYQIGQAMQMHQKQLDELELIGLMHDIGKIAISDSILNKKGKLTEKEYVDMKRHSEIGYRILSASNNMAFIAEYVLKHHERLDGRGYPDQLKADKIPLQSRILSIADSYDAMTSERPYKKKMTAEQAIEELLKNAGTQFDMQIVEVFINKVLKNKQEESA